MSANKDVVIIGAGVIGCSIAYHLAQKGITARIIERESIGARASGKAWAVIPYPPLHLASEKAPGSLFTMPEGESLQPWLELFWNGYHRMHDIACDIREKGGIDIEYGEFPFTMISTSEKSEAVIRPMASFFRERGFHEVEWLSADDLKRIFADINPKVRGGISVPELQVEPYKYTLGLAQTAEKTGTEVKQGEVVGFGTKGAKITSVKLSSGTEIEADVVVITMGPWSGQGTSWLGKEVPIQLNMEQCLRMQVDRDFPLHSLNNGRFTVIPKINGDVILGLAGAFDLKDDFDSSLSEEIKMTIMEGAIYSIPGLADARLIEHRGDLQAWAPGPAYNKPVMGPLPEWENAYVATRFGTLGMAMSAGTGQYMADYIAGGEVPARVRRMLDHLDPAAAI
jgi:glycine oxidase